MLTVPTSWVIPTGCSLQKDARLYWPGDDIGARYSRQNRSPSTGKKNGWSKLNGRVIKDSTYPSYQESDEVLQRNIGLSALSGSSTEPLDADLSENDVMDIGVVDQLFNKCKCLTRGRQIT